MTRWGLVATLKAPPGDILDFTAYHLAQGAHRLFLYLDAPDETLAQRLETAPGVRAICCDAEWWARRGGRPEKHQARQVRNARHAYRHGRDVDWLAHIDVDEFICSDWPLADRLGDLPEQCFCARMRPIEALAGAEGLFKAFHRDHGRRSAAAQRLYPRFGRYLNGGFLSHVAGKLVYRTGLPELRAKIHNIRVGETENPGEVALDDVALAHLHAPSWERWRAQFDYRHARGSYRAELKGRGGLTPHALLAGLLESEGEAGLRAFFEEVCAATPAHVEALDAEGLLRRRDLGLKEARNRFFPQKLDALAPGDLTPPPSPR